MRLRINAVIFDYGNVLSRVPEQDDIEAMAAIMRVDTERFLEGYWRHRLEYDCGMPSSAYWQTVADFLRIELNQGEADQLTKIDAISWSRPNSNMAQLAYRLHRAGIELAILSNMPTDIKIYLENNCDWLPEFVHRTYSCDLKFAKPDPRIYEHSVNKMARHEERIVFIDDRQENIDAARKIGINSLLFSGFERLVEDLGETSLKEHLE